MLILKIAVIIYKFRGFRHRRKLRRFLRTQKERGNPALSKMTRGYLTNREVYVSGDLNEKCFYGKVYLSDQQYPGYFAAISYMLSGNLKYSKYKRFLPYEINVISSMKKL